MENLKKAWLSWNSKSSPKERFTWDEWLDEHLYFSNY